jgi:peptide deformylase
MTLFPIRTFGDPVLNTRAAAVTEFDEQLRRLVDDMIETMYDAPGVGLAAPQIGVSKRIFVFDASDETGAHAVINPQLVETSGSWELEEGCLSVPNYWWEITRPGYAKVRGVDVDQNPVEYAGDELLGRVLQHELDHLEGTLLLARLGRKERKQALRQLREEALGLPTPE